MDIFLTFDYELFFGKVSGSVDKCMIEPTEALLAMAAKQNIHLTFFWDIGHYIALQRFGDVYPSLKVDQSKIEKQLKNALDLGHAIELHIHPHWEKALYINGAWQMNLEQHYKMSDFNEEERKSIFSRYHAALAEFTGKKSYAFRAGGWCIQPFAHFRSLFNEHGIRYDSSTMPGVKWISEQYQLDFTELKTSEPFRFSTDECKEDKQGEFMEYPIASNHYSPLFFWKLYVLGRLFPSQHKMWGDGNFVAQPGGKRESLTKGKMHHASSDGFFASELQTILKNKSKNKDNTLVVIGHPKSSTKYALRKLNAFVAQNKTNHRFLTFEDLPCD